MMRYVVDLVEQAAVSERTMPTERPPLAGEVSATFTDRECRVVSVKYP
jgi:hypothetical protein